MYFVPEAVALAVRLYFQWAPRMTDRRDRRRVRPQASHSQLGPRSGVKLIVARSAKQPINAIAAKQNIVAGGKLVIDIEP